MTDFPHASYRPSDSTHYIQIIQTLTPPSPDAPPKFSDLRARRKSAPELSLCSPKSSPGSGSLTDDDTFLGHRSKTSQRSETRDVAISVQAPCTPPCTPPWKTKDFLRYGPQEAADAPIGHKPGEITGIDRQIQSTSAASSPRASHSNVIRKIPKPQFPICVSRSQPKAFSSEAQRESMKWSHERRHFWPDPVWLEEPSIQHIKEISWPYLEYLGACDRDIRIEFLAEGGFNRVFTIHTFNMISNSEVDYVFRVTLPVDPYYKTESDVATTELVRHFTSVPVPIIYAYDSSTTNVLGLEWMLMEKISGQRLDEAWGRLGYDSKLRLTRVIAGWTAELATISCDKIGSIFMRHTAKELEFYVGRSVNALLSQENRLKYNAFRGPYKSIEDYYRALLTLEYQDVEDLICAFDSGNFTFTATSSKLKGTFLDQSIMYYIEGHEDWTDSEWRAEQNRELEVLSEAIKKFREALPLICAKAPETSRLLSTFLCHNDISRRNIFVNSAGLPIALLDWESIQMAPLIFLTDSPNFILSYVEEDEPEVNEVESEACWNRYGYSEKEKVEFRRLNAECCAEKMEHFICTKLRGEYQKQLQRLGCPLANAIWEDQFFLDQQLQRRIKNISKDADDHLEWINAMVEMEESEDEEDQDMEMETTGTVEDQEARLRDQGYGEKSIELWRKGIWQLQVHE